MLAKIHTYADKSYSLELEIDWATGKTNIAERHESNHMHSFYQHHGHESVYALPDAITEDDWQAFVAELQPLVDEVVEGYDKRWDGNNMVASFTEDVVPVIEAIEYLIENYSWATIEVWDAEEWVSDGPIGYDINGDRGGDVVRYEIYNHTITWETSDGQLQEIVTDLESDGRAVIVRGMYYYLDGLREECIKNYQTVEQEIIEAIEENENIPEPATLHTVRLFVSKSKIARESADAMQEAFNRMPCLPMETARLYSHRELQDAMERAYHEGNPKLRQSNRSGEIIFKECCWPRWMGGYWIGVNDLRLDKENITAARWQMDHAGIKY